MAEKAIEFWRSLDLVGLQKDLDKDAEEIGKRREESEVSRRELVETSQTFRANAPEVRCNFSRSTYYDLLLHFVRHDLSKKKILLSLILTNRT